MTPPVRSFIAIELSSAAAARLADAQNRLKGVLPANTVRWPSAEAIHLTLHFLGDVTAPNIELVRAALPAAASTCPSFSLALSGLGCFPNTRRPTIVWVGVTGQLDILTRLHRELGQQLYQSIGFKPEARPYAPHLTIGRVKKDLSPHLLTALGQAIEQERPLVGQLSTLQVTQISLIKSDLKPAGPVYTPLAHALLNGSVT